MTGAQAGRMHSIDEPLEGVIPASARSIGTVKAGERDRLWVMGSPLQIIVTGEETAGAYAVVEDRSMPGFGPPPHIHHREDEAFYVIEGEYLFGSDEGEIRLGPGRFVHAPKADSIGGATSAKAADATSKCSCLEGWKKCSRRLASR